MFMLSRQVNKTVECWCCVCN